MHVAINNTTKQQPQHQFLGMCWEQICTSVTIICHCITFLEEPTIGFLSHLKQTPLMFL